MKKPTLLIDRDGVLNPFLETSEGKISPQNVEEFEFLPGAKKSLQKAEEEGFQIIVFTNQPDVGKNWRELDKKKLEQINQILKERGVDAVYSCNHGPLREEKDETYYAEDGEIIVCDCRKPQSGLIENIFQDYEISVEESYVVGDSEVDLKAAENYEKDHEVSFAGKFRIGEDTEIGHQTFDNLNDIIKYIAGDNT